MFFFVFLIAFGFAGYYGNSIYKTNVSRQKIFGKIIEIHFKAQREGDLNRLLVPRDTDGYQCGQDSEVLNKKYLVFFDLSKCADPLTPLNGCLTPQTCVESCPSSNFVHDRTVCEKDFAAYKERLICTRHVDMKSIKNCDDVHTRISNDQCAKWYLKSEPCKLNCSVKNRIAVDSTIEF